MTHPPGQPGGGGGSNGGTSGPGRTDRLLAYADMAIDWAARALNADAYTSLVDTFCARQMRYGYGPDHIDRNGRLLEVTR